VPALQADHGSIDALGTRPESDPVELVVLTADDPFLNTLREAIGPARRVWHFSSPDKVSDLLVAGKVGILILDAAASSGGGAGFVAQIRRQFPDLVLLVAGTREDEAVYAAAISSGSVYRFIHKPLSPARAKLFVETAVRRHSELSRTPPPVAAPASLSPKSRRGLAILAALLLIVAAVAVFVIRRGVSHPLAGLPVAATASPVSLLLARAAEALNDNRLTEPAGNNALEMYTMLLARSPGDPQARAGITEVHERLLARAENALLEERFDEAQAAIDTAKRAGVESGRISFLSAQLQKSRDRAKPNQPRAGQQADQGSDKLRQLLRVAAQRMDEGKLVDPDADSARHYLQEAIRLDAANVNTQQAAHALGTRLLLEIRGMIDRKEYDAATRWLQLSTGIASRADINAVKNALSQARGPAQGDARERLLNLATQRLEQDHLIEPANDSAKYYLQTLRAQDPAFAGLALSTQNLGARIVEKAKRAFALQQYDAAKSWLAEADALAYTSDDLSSLKRNVEQALASQAGQNNVISANSLARTKTVAPQYPSSASNKSVEGWVELEFTITVNGQVKDISVKDAKPAGVFEHAAIDGVSQWRFVPIIRDNKAVEQRARIRVRFNISS
jgi:TonB family protein